MKAIKARKVESVIQISDAITRPANTTQYAAGDALSEVTTNDFFTLTSGNEIATRRGVIVGASLFTTAYSATPPSIDILLFNNPSDLPTETADNATVAITDAEMLFCVARLQFLTGNWTRGGTNMFQDLELNRHIRIPNVDGAFSLYGQAVLQNIYTPASGEVFTLSLTVRLD